MAENTGPFCYQIENLCSTTSLMWGSLRCTTRRSLYMGLYPTRRNQGSNSDLKALFPDEDGCKTRKHIQQTSTTSKVIPSKKSTTASFNLHHMHGSDTFKTHLKKACCVAWSLPMRESAICTSMRETAYSKVIQSCT